jgi:2-iminobutanoate/2-iminopropanoate deaminase
MQRASIVVDGIAPPKAHYSHGIVGSGTWLFVAGQLPVDRDGAIVPGGASEQAAQVLDNLQAVVEAAGGTLSDVVKTTVFLTDLANRGAVGQVRQRYFTTAPPANTLLVVSSLADPAYLVEIEAIALLPDRAAPGGGSPSGSDDLRQES